MEIKEIFEVEYNGTKYTAEKRNGRISVTFPPIGPGYRESILRDGELGWRLHSSHGPESHTTVWLRDNGSVAWASDSQYGIEESWGPFTPGNPNAGCASYSALKLYQIVQQIKAYEEKNIPAAELCSLREHYLKTTLKLLGYDSIDAIGEELDDSRGYLALARVAEQLEEYRDISAYVHSISKSEEEDIVSCTVPPDVNRTEILEFAKPVKEQIEQNVQFMQQQERELGRKRKVNPQYRREMSKKAGVFSWDCYKKAVKDTAILLLELNADLLTPEQREKFGIAEFRVADELEVKDRISEVIDSTDYNDACRIESEFACAESEILVSRANEQLQGMSESQIKSSEGTSLQELVKEEKRMIQFFEESIKRHDTDAYLKGATSGAVEGHVMEDDDYMP